MRQITIAEYCRIRRLHDWLLRVLFAEMAILLVIGATIGIRGEWVIPFKLMLWLVFLFGGVASLLLMGVVLWGRFHVDVWRCPKCGERFADRTQGPPRDTCCHCGVSLGELD